MGIFNWLTSKATKEDLKKVEKSNKLSFKNVKKDMETIKLELKNSSKILNTHSSQIEIIKKRTLSLEKILQPEEELPTKRLNAPTKRLNAFKKPFKQPIENFSVEKFTDKEQNILKILLNHRDMALSYKDIGKELGKSPNTIKCQFNSMRNKSNIFNETIGEDNKHRYKLKSGLSISKSFDV